MYGEVNIRDARYKLQLGPTLPDADLLRRDSLVPQLEPLRIVSRYLRVAGVSPLNLNTSPEWGSKD